MLNRNTTIDIARGIGIFFVLWGHTQCDFKSYIYVFHMPLFFILSGYFFNSNDGPIVTFKKKIRSLGIPFIFFVIFQRIGFVILSLVGGTFKFSYLLVWTPMEPWGHIGVLWFFISLFTVSIIFSFVNKIPSEIFQLLACLSLTYVGYLLSNRNIHLPVKLDSSLSMVFLFYMGEKLNHLNIDKIKSFKVWLLLSLISILLSVLCLNLYLPIIDVSVNIFKGEFLISLAIMILCCITILISSKLIEFIPYLKSVLVYFGQNSLTIFATHPVLLGSIYLVFQFNRIAAASGILNVLLMFGASLPLIFLLKKYFPFVFTKKKAVVVIP